MNDDRSFPGGPGAGSRLDTPLGYLAALDASVAKARAALAGTTDDHLMTPWRFLVAGKVASEPQYSVIVGRPILA